MGLGLAKILENFHIFNFQNVPNFKMTHLIGHTKLADQMLCYFQIQTIFEKNTKNFCKKYQSYKPNN